MIKGEEKRENEERDKFSERGHFDLKGLDIRIFHPYYKAVIFPWLLY